MWTGEKEGGLANKSVYGWKDLLSSWVVGFLTQHVTRSSIHSEKFLVVQGFRQSDQKSCAAFQTSQGILLRVLHPPGQHLHCNLLQTGSIDLAWLRGVTAEETTLEHFQRCDSQSFTARKDLAGFLGFVGPPGTCACIEQHGDNEKIDQTAGSLLGVNRTRPGLKQLVDTRSSTNIEVLPAAMRRDRSVVGSIISLFRWLTRTSQIERIT